MKKLFPVALFFLVIGVGLMVACGQTLQKKSIVFKVPAGWKSVVRGETTVLVPGDVNENSKLLILVLPVQQIKADLKQAFEAVLANALASNERLVQQGSIEADKSAEGYDILTKNMIVEEQNGSNRTVRIYTAVGSGKEMGIFAVVFNNEAAAKKYQRGVDEFYASYEFSGDKSAASTKNGDSANKTENQEAREDETVDISALYVANILISRPKTFGGIGYEYVNFNEFWLLLPGGRIYFGIPSGNSGDFDFRAACQTKPEKCGTYRIAGGRYEFEWRGQKISFLRNVASVPLGRTHSGQSGNTVFRKISAENNLRLEGVFARRSFTDVSSGTVASGNVSGETRIAFSGDGRFAVSGFTGFTVQSGRSGATGSGASQGTGTYTIRNNALLLKFADGRQSRLLFFRFPDEEEKIISIDGVNYLRSDN